MAPQNKRRMSKKGEAGWSEYGKHVLAELERLNENISKLTDAYNQESKKIWTEIATLKTKAGLWGLMGGVLAVIPTIVIILLEKK